MNKAIGLCIFIAIPAGIGYGAGKLFGASNKTTIWLTIGGAIIGAGTELLFYETLKRIQQMWLLMIGFYRWLLIIAVYLFSTLISIYFIENMYAKVQKRQIMDKQNFDNVMLARSFLHTLCFVPGINTLYAAGLLYKFFTGLFKK